jgi:SAM-dependent methyltransferase
MIFLKPWLKSSSLFNFNQIERDKWVASQAKQLSAGSKVLDVGAGSCPYRKFFTHCEYKTQDFGSLSGEQLSLGQYGQIDYLCDAAAIPVQDSTFDAVLCTEVLEHLSDPQVAIKEFTRILKPGGKLLLTAPLGSGIHQEPYHFYGGFTSFWYEKYLPKFGFKIIKIEQNHGSFRFFAQESIRFIRETRPAKLPMSLAMQFLWLLSWLVLLPILALFVPLWCAYLDRFDQQKRFTVGYHVAAIKTGQSEPRL